jgi:hypothetical protein
LLDKQGVHSLVTAYNKNSTILSCSLFTGKRTQELICVYICIALMILNLALIIKHFRIERLNTVIVAAFFGILTADFGSGLVHWGEFEGHKMTVNVCVILLCGFQELTHGVPWTCPSLER